MRFNLLLASALCACFALSTAAQSQTLPGQPGNLVAARDHENLFKVPVGYIAEGALDTTANSDYVGPWRGRLTRPIFSIDGKQVLFPAGSVVTGTVFRIEGPNEAIHNRLGFMPEYIVDADGQEYALTDQAILDREGINGLHDLVDYHLAEQLGASGAYTALNVLPEILVDRFTEDGSQNADTIENFSGDLGERGEAILQKYISLIPTETIRAKTPFRIFFTKPLEVPASRPVHQFKLSN